MLLKVSLGRSVEKSLFAPVMVLDDRADEPYAKVTYSPEYSIKRSGLIFLLKR
ncbi:MAG: hypothetical protein QM534_14435 [Sediminibacterium sp.]|nr:hypothetical protein [Sediminibacterium sp.]